MENSYISESKLLLIKQIDKTLKEFISNLKLFSNLPYFIEILEHCSKILKNFSNIPIFYAKIIGTVTRRNFYKVSQIDSRFFIKFS